MAEEFVAMIEPDGIGAEQPAHSRPQIGGRGSNHQVKVITHQTIGVVLPSRLLASLGECLEKILTMRKNRGEWQTN